MSEPFVGEIRMFAGNFAPRGWALCDGPLLAVAQNDALFSLFGTIYGGDGRTTFGLPDLRGRIPIHAESGPGLNPRSLGRKGGAEQVTVIVNQLPAHAHGSLHASPGLASTADPSGNLPARSTTVDSYINEAPTVRLAPGAVATTGGGQPHNNLQPFLCVNFIVALVGIYPSRS